ncbi:glycosyltransferase family 20-domain-containing protein [Tuber brumale]|nr:glycosyltransferase family 20-domain-containing protein [Tuber brumale]
MREGSSTSAPPLEALPIQQNASFTSNKPHKPPPLANETSIPKTFAPTDAPQGLPLTGRVISAACFLPYTLGYRHGGEWEVGNRRGSSALYDSLKRLGDSGWERVLVGWTGEVRELGGETNADVGGGLGSGSTGQARGLKRNMSYHVSPPVPVINDGGNRMTMKGAYGKKEEDETVRISKEDREAAETALAEKGKEDGWGDINPVWLGDDEKGLPIDGVDRWRDYAERVIWPLFHYILPQHVSSKEEAALEERAWWRDYRLFSDAFADAIVKVYKEGDIIWIHDYHLLILPELLRQRLGKGAYIGLFVHTPWPTSEIFRVLPRRRPILAGMLASNMVAFQSETYKLHFIMCCKKLLNLTESSDREGRAKGVNAFGAHCAVEALPIGIDAEKVLKLAEGPNVAAKMETIRKAYEGMRIIVGRDRLDSVRGVVQKLRVFEMFLERHPEFIGQVVLIQVTSPSSLSQSSTIEHQVAELVSHINGKYGSLHYSPVHHYPQYLDPDEYFALLRVADLGLITSIRDGMNTTSLEYIICQQETHGPVILSEFTGTAESLTDAVIVNPTNTKGVADTIATCLNLTPADKSKLQRKLYKYVITNTVQSWNSAFLAKLTMELSYNQGCPLTPALDLKRLYTTYNEMEKDLKTGGVGERIFMLDYDGTLTHIMDDPVQATPSDKVVRCIKKLAQQQGNRVWIISGRDQAFLEKWLGHISELGLSAEHGCFMREPGSDKWVNLAERMNMSWSALCIDIFNRYTERTPGSFVERKSVAVTWHYRRSDQQLGESQAKECMAELESAMEERGYDVEVMTGKANLEVRPRFVNKGEIARKLVAEAEGTPAMVFCAGDDTTDEDMFRALQQSDLPKERLFTVTVGPSSKPTEANHHLLEPENVIECVGLLVGTVKPRDLGIIV